MSLPMLDGIWARFRGKLLMVGVLAVAGPLSHNSSAPASPPQKPRTAFQSSKAAAASFPKTLPDGVTEQMVEEGRVIFHGSGGCIRCHGENGSGTFLAPALNDEERIHLRTASYQEILELVRSGVAQPKRSVTVMPPLGGASLTAQQLRAVAAYAFSLDRGPSQRPWISAVPVRELFTQPRGPCPGGTYVLTAPPNVERRTLNVERLYELRR